MANINETARKAALHRQSLDQLTTTMNANHVPAAPQPKNETDRINQIILSNLAAKDD